MTFSYSLRNTGGAAAPGIVWAAQGWRNGAAETPSGTRTGTATGLPPRGSPRTIRPAESFLFSGSVGSSVCRRINYDPTSSTDSTSAWSAYVCATIIATPPPPVPPATLTPYLNMTPSPTAPYGAMLRAVPGYNGPGPAARRADVAYTFTVWNDISRNGVYDAAQDSMLSNVSGPRTSRTVAGEAFPDWNEIASISRHGDRVCARVQITTFDPLVSAGSPVTRCVTLIGKQPHMSVTTGDTWAGGSLTRLPAGGCAAPSATPSIKASAFSVGGTNYGSYGGLAVGSLGTIAAFGSNGLPHEVANLSTRLLTLSNGGTYGNFGGVATCLNDAFAIYEPHATGTYAGTTVAVPAMTLTPGQRKIIVINGNALITGDIKYQDGPYASPDQLPQLVLLVRGDIKVRSDVGRIDGLYVATRSFHTCVTSAANPMSMGGACDQKQLEVNGPVIAGDALITPRVYGASVGSGYGVQAERFDLRPDFLLSEYQRAAGGSAIQTMSETELPPRF